MKFNKAKLKKPAIGLSGSANSTPGCYRIFLRHKRTSRLLLVAAIIVFSGCAHAKVEIVEDTTDIFSAQPAEPGIELGISGGEYLYLSDDAVVIVAADQADSVRVPAVNPTAANWLNNEAGIIWVQEQASAGYSLMRQDFAGSPAEQIYWSRTPIQELSASANNSLIIFIQDDSLYILSVSSGLVTRLAEEITAYVWAPDILRLAISKSDDLLVTDLQSDGTIKSSQELTSKGSLQGLAFRDRHILVSMDVESDRISLVEFDLREQDGSKKVINEWQVPAEETSKYSYELLISPNATQVLVQERLLENITSTLFTFSPVRKENIEYEGEIIGWQDRSSLAIAKKVKDDIVGKQYSIFSIDSRTLKEVRLEENIAIPHFIR